MFLSSSSKHFMPVKFFHSSSLSRLYPNYKWPLLSFLVRLPEDPQPSLFFVVNLTQSGMDYSPKLEGTLVILRQKDSTPLIQILRLEGKVLIRILRWEGTLLIWTTPPSGSLYKDDGRRRVALLFVCLLSLCQHIHPFSGPGAYFFEIPTYPEGQLRHPALQDWADTRFLDVPFTAMPRKRQNK